MEYFDNLLQEYEQYGIQKSFCFSNMEDQLALDEPELVIWEEEATKVRFSSYREYADFVKSNNNNYKFVAIIDDSAKANDIYNVLTSYTGDYEALVSNISELIKSNANRLSLR